MQYIRPSLGYVRSLTTIQKLKSRREMKEFYSNNINTSVRMYRGMNASNDEKHL